MSRDHARVAWTFAVVLAAFGALSVHLWCPDGETPCGLSHGVLRVGLVALLVCWIAGLVVLARTTRP